MCTFNLYIHVCKCVYHFPGVDVRVRCWHVLLYIGRCKCYRYMCMCVCVCVCLFLHSSNHTISETTSNKKVKEQNPRSAYLFSQKNIPRINGNGACDPCVDCTQTDTDTGTGTDTDTDTKTRHDASDDLGAERYAFKVLQV
jgi:hypothetical protein